MTLTGRFSALFLAALALVLAAFSIALYISARVYFSGQVEDRLSAGLSVLAAAAEIHPEGVEWEPQERILPLGQESGNDRLCWMVFDERGRRVDQSRNLADTELTPAWRPTSVMASLPSRLRDRQGRAWRVAQRRLRPDALAGSGSRGAAGRQGPADPNPPERLYRNLMLTVCAPLDRMEATLTELGWFLGAVSAGIWLLGGLLCRRLSRRALEPLARMVASARGLDASDPGWCLVEAGTRDELDELGRAFNDLLSRLHVAYERQRRFSSHASHQLRTPLTVLIGQVEVALRQERSGDEYRRVLKSALGRASQLAQIIEALLFLGRAEGDAQLPDGELLDLSEWVATQVSGRPVTARSLEEQPLRVRIHPSLLGQVLDNLIDNANKYGQPGGDVVVETLREGRMGVLAVEDNGPGIPPAELARVFEPFYRSSDSRRHGTPGAGLGLAVVERIAVAFGGTVGIRSEPGKGCRVEVRLPLDASEPAADELAVAEAMSR
jgi:signal transduction histidine kinase